MVLHPRALLPDRQPLVIAQDRTFYVRGQPAQRTLPVTWTYWISDGDHLRSASPPHAPLTPGTPFIVGDVRPECDKPVLSSLAMVINAHYKLGQYMRDHGSSATPRVQKFARLMSELVTAIFFLPPRYPSATTRSQPVQVLRRSPRTIRATSSLPTSVADQVPVLGLHQGQNARYGVMEDSSDPPGEDPDLVEPPEPTDADGLTASEFRLVAARARDPLLDAKERASSAMTMLFGTHCEYKQFVLINL